jgi:putative tricarboxylic transport membrane protein
VNSDKSNPSRSATIVWLRQDFAGGLVIVGVAAFAFWQGSDLPIGTLGGMGPGMLPRSLAVLLGSTPSWKTDRRSGDGRSAAPS